MFKKLVPLQARQHADLRMSETTDWRFAAQEMVVPIVFTEMADAAREYPLVFLKDKTVLCALLGLEHGANAYVDEQGRWLANYVPARLRAYPLNLARVPEKPQEMAIVLDVEAPQLMTPDGQPLFVGGKPSAFLSARMELLKGIHAAEAVTGAMVDVIRDAGLLVERTIRIRRDGGNVELGGLQVIDEKMLNELSAERFAQLRQKGVLPLVYAHLLSMANLRHGAIAGKYPELAKRRQEAIDEMMRSEIVRFN